MCNTMEKFDTETIRALYKLKDSQRAEIESFLEEHDFLVPYIENAYNCIKRIAGDFPLEIELYSDPEEDWQYINIVVRTNLDADSAVELENRLFNEWFIDIIPETKQLLGFCEDKL